MGLPVVTVAAGGLAVVEATFGVPVTEATNGYGIAVTKVTGGKPGLPVVFDFVPATMNGTVTAVTLSNGGLTATHTSTALGMAGVSNADGKTTGKYYFEALFTATHGASDCVTVSLTGSTILGIISSGQLTTAVYAGTGNIRSNNVNTGKNLGVTVSGDIIGVAVDLGARVGWFRRYRGTAGNWNNDAAANPATGVGGVTMAPTLAAFPNVGFGGTGTAINDIITVNFGASAFAMPVPAGFTPGWPA